MAEDVALIGNGRIIGRVRTNGVLEDVFFPSKGFHRHIIRSQFGVFLSQRRQMTWLAEDWTVEQDYLDETFVVETLYSHSAGLEARLVDFVPATHDVYVRVLEVRNRRAYPQEVSIIHAEAAALEENTGDFSFNAAYVNRQRRVLRYRGHPFDNSREAHCCMLIGGDPAPEEFQVGRSYTDCGDEIDAFQDAADGRFQGNSLCTGSEHGATSGLLWHGTIAPGRSLRVRVTVACGSHTGEAEERLKQAEARPAEELLDEAKRWWRGWIAAAEPAVKNVPGARLRRLARRSLLMLRLLQHENGAFVAAPTLYPDYRYCWPRDAAYMAWMLSRWGYREEADRFFLWSAGSQAASGFWHQNYYTDSRPHWTALQVDQAGAVLWALGEHLDRHPNLSLATELWPMVRSAADALERLIDPDTGMISSPQDLWEECGGTFAYTNATCVAGFQAAGEIAGRLGLPAARSTYRRRASEILAAMRAALVVDGKVIADLHPHRSHAAREHYVDDISTVGLAAPYALVEASWPPLMHSAEAIERAFHWPAGGIGRYPGDHFEGGNPWPLCSLWLAGFFLAAGQQDRALRHLEWALEQVTPLGHFPEQVQHTSGHPVSALPLGWAHAWYLWLLQELYLRTALAPAPNGSKGPDGKKEALV